MNSSHLLSLILGILLGVAGGYIFLTTYSKKKLDSFLKEGKEKQEIILKDAENKAKDIEIEAKQKALNIIEDAKKEEREKTNKLHDLESKLLSKENNLEERKNRLDSIEERLEDKVEILKKSKEALQKKEELLNTELQRISKLTKTEAREILLAQYEKEYEDDILKSIRKTEERIKEDADKKAKNIIVGAIQRYASEVASENTATTVELPNDEMKGRIIGREGRNINAFEQMIGVDVIVDDSPETILISGFDIRRRYIAKRALEELIKDGRIHPARIEEVVEKVTKEVNQMIKESGEEACMELGITDFAPDLVKLVGRLRFRTSYGQNILKHSVEVAIIAGELANQLGLNADLVKRAGLLHDIGKGVDHEIEGSHASIGAQIAKKFKLHDVIINSIEAHHEDTEYKSLEAIIVQAADAISGSRIGARRESVEVYIKRLQELENIALGFDGVKKSYAIQAGREVRVIVDPEDITDLEAKKMAYEIARKIESELVYPGEIKVNIIREVRSVETAK